MESHQDVKREGTVTFALVDRLAQSHHSSQRTCVGCSTSGSLPPAKCGTNGWLYKKERKRCRKSDWSSRGINGVVSSRSRNFYRS